MLVNFLAISAVGATLSNAFVAKDKVSYEDLGITNWTPAFDTYSGYVTVKNLPVKAMVSGMGNVTAVDQHVHYM